MIKLSCNDENIITAADEIKKGKVVVYPTDTVYGIGCDPYNDSAVDRIFKIKGRMEGKPLPILCSSIKHASRIAKLSEHAVKLATQFWPGTLTLIAELIDYKISGKVIAGTNTIGVRVPNHQCALQLIDKCGGILVGTSANKSGYNSARSATEVLETLQGFDILLDGGSTPVGVESTVIDVSSANIAFIREGSIRRERIAKVLEHV
ncbi:MAG: L-threonylcarbamoyladenylate synthase [Nitrososphaerales archaeon]